MAVRTSPDRGLQARMAVVTLLLVVANAAFVALALELLTFTPGWAVPALELPEKASVLGPGWPRTVRETGRSLRELALWRSPVVVPLTALFLLAQYEYVSRRPLRPASVSRATGPPPALERRVRRLAQQASVRSPSVAVTHASTPNCYTVGRRGAATIVVSDALLDALDGDELDAVLAHELAHVQNRDVTVMTLAAAPFQLARSVGTTLDRTVYRLGVFVYALSMLGLVVVTLALLVVLVLSALQGVYDWFVGLLPLLGPGPLLPVGPALEPDALLWAAGKFTDLISIAGAYPLVVLVLILPSLGALCAYYVTLGVVPRWFSAYREYAADRGAALLTGDPAALASALETLSYASPRPRPDYRQATAVQALFLLPGGFDEVDRGPIAEYLLEERPWFGAVVERIPLGVVAHPDTGDRVDRLRALVES